MINPKIAISQKSIVATNPDGQKLISALKVFIKQIDPETLIQLAETVKKDPGLIKQAMNYKHLIL